MATFTIYHKVGPNIFRTAHESSTGARLPHPLDPAEYHPAAVVIAENRGQVFQLCNSIDAFWQENPEVRKAFPNSERSLSVGDLIVEEDGTIYEIEGAGYCRHGSLPELPFVDQ